MNIVILIFVLMLIIYGFIIIDLYPIWDDFNMRYIMKKSYKTNTSIDIHFNNLDTILNKSGDFEGHIGCSKNKINYILDILKKYNIKCVAEIGFNAGHSTSLFLDNKNINKVISFDLCKHKYSKKCLQYIQKTFNNRFDIICGDSTITIPIYINKYVFDLIFIDGGHYDNIPFLDIQNTIRYLSNKNTLLLIDDTYYSFIINKLTKHTVDKAVFYYIKHNKIKKISSIPGLSLYTLL